MLGDDYQKFLKARERKQKASGATPSKSPLEDEEEDSFITGPRHKINNVEQILNIKSSYHDDNGSKEDNKIKEDDSFKLFSKVITELLLEIVYRIKQKDFHELEEIFTPNETRRSLILHQAVLLNNSNPMGRILLGKNGLCEEELKNDPITKVRIETLISTGAYSKNYRNETDNEMIKELIIQGIDLEFFKNSSNKDHSKLAEKMEVAYEIYEKIEQGDKQVFDTFKLSVDNQKFNLNAKLPVEELIEYSKIICENAYSTLEALNQEQQKNIASYRFIQENQERLKQMPTPFGKFVGINNQEQVVEFEDSLNNEIILINYKEVETFLNSF